jgi:hypothetical protein
LGQGAFRLRVELAIKLRKIRPEPITAMGPGSALAGGGVLSDDFDAPTRSGSKHRHIKKVMRIFMIKYLYHSVLGLIKERVSEKQ